MELLEGKMYGTSSLKNVSTKLQQIANLARMAPRMVMTTLAHHIDMELMRVAYMRTRKDGAVGVDGQTAASYATNLEENLGLLLNRFKSGTYRAPPVRRQYIPKGDGKKTRPIGIPTFEDKVLQRAVVMVLEAVYEQDFSSCSYGFRSAKSAHQALEALWQDLMRCRGGWIIDLDIQDFFGSVVHSHMRDFLDQRVCDGVMRRAIDKWLKAGVMENGILRHPGAGTPQGGVVSPLLANIYLHEVLDKWFEEQVRPRLRGEAFLIRYADDAVLIFAREEDARRVMNVLPKRMAKYGLTLHPAKTRLLEFQSPRSAGAARPVASSEKRTSFEFLGFNHHWGKSRRGYWVVKRKTASSRFSRALTRIAQWCRANRHQPVKDQWVALSAKCRGHYGYFGITGNARALGRFAYAVHRIWNKWLNRRSHRAKMDWARFNRLLKRYPLPSPKVVHSIYYAQRIHRSRSRMR